MIVTGASTEDVALIVRAVSETKYDGNVEIREISDKSSSRTVRTSFTLRVRDGHAGSKGAKGSSGYESSGTGPNGLRCSSLVACWHVHYDVLETLFRHHPQAKVSTALAKYSAADFHLKAIETAVLLDMGDRARNRTTRQIYVSVSTTRTARPSASSSMRTQHATLGFTPNRCASTKPTLPTLSWESTPQTVLTRTIYSPARIVAAARTSRRRTHGTLELSHPQRRPRCTTSKRAKRVRYGWPTVSRVAGTARCTTATAT